MHAHTHKYAFTVCRVPGSRQHSGPLRIGSAVVAALQSMHDKGLVHGDLVLVAAVGSDWSTSFSGS